eukprot:763140-Hanusia_phi.AAC.2
MQESNCRQLFSPISRLSQGSGRMFLVSITSILVDEMEQEKHSSASAPSLSDLEHLSPSVLPYLTSRTPCPPLPFSLPPSLSLIRLPRMLDLLATS